MSDKFDFEKSLAELEKVVTALENNDVSLDEAIALFEKGVELSNQCRKTLESAQNKIVKLTGDNND
jgi:exodeoxyribonuclease VII small subunit